jgi:hypothetical protein
VDVFEGELPSIGVFDALSLIQGLCEPYILLRANLEKTYLYEAEAAASQAVRRRLSEKLGIPVWDWRVDGRNSVINETVEFWKEALHNV